MEIEREPDVRLLGGRTRCGLEGLRRLRGLQALHRATLTRQDEVGAVLVDVRVDLTGQDDVRAVVQNVRVERGSDGRAHGEGSEDKRCGEGAHVAGDCDVDLQVEYGIS